MLRAFCDASRDVSCSADYFTCADGEQIAVDMLSGLSSVPENRRKEVQQQLTQLKSLAEAALR